MNLTFKGRKKAYKVFDKIAMTPDDEMYITKKAFKGVQEARNDIKKNHFWKDRTGKLTRTHYAKIRKTWTIEIGAKAKHAKYLFYGTKAHMIRPKKKKALAWKVGGTTFFSKGHMVKGIKGRDWLRPAINRRMNSITRYMMKATKLRMRK